MTLIKNVHPLNAEKLFDLLKKEFPDYINHKLDSELSIDFAYVYDVINVMFPEVIEGTVFTITVSGDEIRVSDNTHQSGYNAALLEEHLINFVHLMAA